MTRPMNLLGDFDIVFLLLLLLHFAPQVVGGAVLGVLLGWWESRHAGGILLPRVLGLLGRRKPKSTKAQP